MVTWIGYLAELQIPNIGGTAKFGWGPDRPRGVVKGWSSGSGGLGIFRWEPSSELLLESKKHQIIGDEDFLSG